MSRRPPSGADRAEANRATLKSLVKLEANKTCADCKRNKHPRWASWNLGVFVCIRCSGIHRGMGTHISRVKSVDLDSWTDEQMASMVRWGNARANKYWESKLAEGHVPNESKIENFIRTKYDSKRWVMDGPMPDPATLDDGQINDDDVPLNVVKEKARERAASMRNGQAAGAGGSLPGPPRQRQPEVDLFGDEPAQSQPARPRTTDSFGVSREPPVVKAPAAPPKQTKPGESLLGLDFFGGSQTALPARAASASPGTGMPGVPGRTDLKQSILSLYASKPAPPAQTQQPTANAFGGMQSPPLASPTQQPQGNAQPFGGMNDAFSSLSFGSPQQQPAKPAPFSNLASPTGHNRQSSFARSSLSGGSFFDTQPQKPTPPPLQKPQVASNDFGDFGAFSSGPSPVTATKSPPPPSSSMGDLFNLSAPAPAPQPSSTMSPPIQPQQPQRQPSYSANSAFNLSSPAATTAQAPKAAPTTSFSSIGNMDAWGSNDAWSTPDAAAAAPKPAPAPAQTSAMNLPMQSPPVSKQPTNAFDTGGWGDPEPSAPKSAPAPAPAAAPTTVNAAPQTPGGWGNTSSSAGGFNVQQDEEFGGWSHASPVATNSGPKQGGVGGNADDLFGNVWG